MRRTSDEDDPDDATTTTTPTTTTAVDALVAGVEALNVKPETKTEIKTERATSSVTTSSDGGRVGVDEQDAVPTVRRKRSVVVARRMIANALDIDLDGARVSSKTEEEKRATREARKKKAEERARERERERERQGELDKGRGDPV